MIRMAATHLDGVGTNAVFNYPTGIVLFNNHTLYVSDTNNNCIRHINVSSGLWHYFSEII